MTPEQKQEVLQKIVEEFVKEILALLSEVKNQEPSNEIVVEASKAALNLKPFFDHIRKPLFSRMSATQVSGHEDIINAMKKHNVPVSWAAYILATAYHETAKKMQPVREGLNASDRWRKANLRYYPWYGRGHVQLTWRENYVKADQKLGLGGALVKDADLALEPEISAEVLVVGSVEGWFSGDRSGRHTLERHLPNRNKATRTQFRNARRIINLLDKADLIAGHALIYQDALIKAGY